MTKLGNKLKATKIINGIYTIWCDDWVYVGKSSNIYSRINHHRSMLRNNKHRSIKMQQLFNDLGEANFTFNILESKITGGDLMKLEERITIKYRGFYNVINVDDGSRRSKETIIKISNTSKEKFNGGNLRWTEETLRKLAGNRIFTMSEFRIKYSGWAVRMAKKFNIADDIFKKYSRGLDYKKIK